MWRILSKEVPGGMGKSGRRAKLCIGRRQVVPTATATETDGVQKTQEDERSSTREPHRGGCSLPKSSGEAVGTFDAPSWNHTGTQRSTVSWISLGAQPPSKARARQFDHPRQVGNFSRQVGPAVPFDEILSGHEEDVSSIRDGFSAWVKTDPETLLKRHVVDAKGLHPAFREAPARRHELSSQEYRFMMTCPTV